MYRQAWAACRQRLSSLYYISNPTLTNSLVGPLMLAKVCGEGLGGPHSPGLRQDGHETKGHVNAARLLHGLNACFDALAYSSPVI